MHPDNKIVSFVVITASYLRFSYAFRPRRESATFLFATMLFSPTKSSDHPDGRVWRTNPTCLCSSNEDFRRLNNALRMRF